jgi:hypothetical protein
MSDSDAHSTQSKPDTNDGGTSVTYVLTPAQKIPVLVAFIAGAITLLVSIFSALIPSQRDTPIPSLIKEETVKQVESIRSTIESQRRDLDALKAKLDGMAASPIGSDPEKQIAELRGQVAAFDQRLGKMEAAIVENPTKALSVPLLRKDVDTLNQTFAQGLEATRKEIDRIYDLNKWFIGLMGTMAIGILGLAIGNFYQAKKDKT